MLSDKPKSALKNTSSNDRTSLPLSWTSLRKTVGTWADAHNGLICVGAAIGTALALVGLMAFIAFSGLDSAADFIYNQF